MKNAQRLLKAVPYICIPKDAKIKIKQKKMTDMKMIIRNCRRTTSNNTRIPRKYRVDRNIRAKRNNLNDVTLSVVELEDVEDVEDVKDEPIVILSPRALFIELLLISIVDNNATHPTIIINKSKQFQKLNKYLLHRNEYNRNIASIVNNTIKTNSKARRDSKIF